MIQLVIVDDQALIRQGLSSLLQTKPDLRVVGEAQNGQVALELIESLVGTPDQPHLILMDVRMPVMDGVATTQQICERWADINVLILSTFDDDAYVTDAMRYGAKGYLLKDTPSEELAEAIRSIHKGYTYLGPGLFAKTQAMMQRITSEVPPEVLTLSPREKEVLKLIATGANNREIAAALTISERTVKNHVSSILGHLQLRDRTQVALLASKFLL
ncbi:response regulator containing a CheY-like receiver domain and an HTH DNA-binding domain [Leptolyngbya sp. PCC 7375]|nr:response regulator containing a CheY-like receiver domain and an HTH DNA-binding domain [Leptolyngbya sp. PCC 7375]